MRTIYVIKNNETGKYIAIDRPSGGYPYDVSIEYAQTFYNKEEPRKYMETMKADWSLHELVMITTETPWEE